ncbi:MAG: CHASE2 domain-containing protein, partial [Nitrospirae bacterium]|nr:CHASE2 domain-containing protein [Magnetococcales bacterium]
MAANHLLLRKWIILSIVTAAFMLAEKTALLQDLELWSYDWGVYTSHRPTDKRIVQIAVDEKSLAALKGWPWDDQYELQLIRMLTQGSPKLIVETRDLMLYRNKTAQHILNTVRSKLEATHHQFQENAASENSDYLKSMSELDNSLSHGIKQLSITEDYARIIGRAGNVILALNGIMMADARTPATSLSAEIIKHAIPTDLSTFPRGAMPSAAIIHGPPSGVASQSMALGVIITPTYPNTVVRTTNLGYNVSGNHFPALALMVAAKSLGIQPSELQLQPDFAMTLGQWEIPHDDNLAMLTCFYPGKSDQSPFSTYSFIDVLEEKVSPTLFRNQIVLIGFTASGLAPRHFTPLGHPLTPMEILANEVATILNHDPFMQPSWAAKTKILQYPIAGVLLIVILARLPLLIALPLGLGFALALMALQMTLMNHYGIWFPLTGVSGLLFLGTLTLAFMTRGSQNGSRPFPGSDADDSNRMLGLALQGQGQMNLAFQQFRLCRCDERTMQLLYNLATDLESNHLVQDAITVLEYMEQNKPGYRDCSKRLESIQAMASGRPVPELSEQPATGPQEALSVLERYHLEEELGRGIFGTVWHGYNHQDHSSVAIKIFPLQERVADEKSFLLVKSIFNRMADHALSLHHPNIIKTKEAQILEGKGVLVMEVHTGVILEHVISPKNLFPLPQVIQMIAKIAMALDYAHRKNIFHGRLKLGNILYNGASREVQLTGFSQTLLLDALTLPDANHPWQRASLHMAPEQTQGEPPTRRSDIYALGRIFFHLVTGTSPPATPITSDLFPSDFPECLGRMIQKCTEY